MDTRIKELINYTKSKFGLDNYDLHTQSLRRSVNIFNETIYTLGMEWFPSHIGAREEDGSNPEGTASIDIDVHTRQFKSVIFVGGKSYADGTKFRNLDKNDIIKWIENETGLRYGKQFQLIKDEKREFRFKECINGVAVSPSGMIEVKFDKEGKLTWFSVNGHFPMKDRVKEETFTLTLENVDSIAHQQLKLIEFPSDEEQKLIPVYAIEEIYVTNDRQSTIPFEYIVERRSYLQIDQTMHWQTPLDKPFEEIKINLSEDVTPEQAFSREPHPDSFAITKMEQEKSIIAVENFLRQEYPNDTEKWILKTLHRDKGYILATLKHAKPDNRVFQRKLQVFLDANSLQVLNYMDNKLMIEMFQDFQEPEKTSISKDEAYEKIRTLIELTPVYVYDFEQKKYILCGKIDCQYGVHAASGEVISLNDL